MTISEQIKLQAKLLEWQVPKWRSVSLMCYKCYDDVWITDGIAIARISAGLNKLNVPECTNIKKYTTLPENAAKAWLTTYTWCDKELGTCVMIKADNDTIWIRKKYIKLFGRAEYDLYVSLDCKTLWLTVPDTREVVGAIAGIRGIKI